MAAWRRPMGGAWSCPPPSCGSSCPGGTGAAPSPSARLGRRLVPEPLRRWPPGSWPPTARCRRSPSCPPPRWEPLRRRPPRIWERLLRSSPCPALSGSSPRRPSSCRRQAQPRDRQPSSRPWPCRRLPS